MPSSSRSGESTKGSAKITTALKQKASNVIKTLIPKRKGKKGLDGDTLSVSSTGSAETLSETSQDKSTGEPQPAVIEVDGKERNDGEEYPEEDADAELSK
jgi:hypothetical protein